MSDLTEFLLARIAEDEEAARSCEDWPECDPVYGCQAHLLPSRALAECEAKRHILEIAVPTVGVSNDFARGWDVGTSFAVRLLAEVYADHPDYREEWRP